MRVMSFWNRFSSDPKFLALFSEAIYLGFVGKHGLGDIWHFDRLMESLVDIFIGDGGVEELKGRLFDLEFFYWMARSFRVFDRVRNE